MITADQRPRQEPSSIFQPLMSAAAATIDRSSITLARAMWIGGEGRPGRQGGRPWKAREH